ncbi:MAG: hypothetical protein EXS25_03920 [Pedosphaera sp.]|nr:hypothetical protein [Pedosphaera sp.]
MLPDESRMMAGLADQKGIQLGGWQDRFIEWFRGLDFYEKLKLKLDQPAREQIMLLIVDPKSLIPTRTQRKIKTHRIGAL